MSITTEQLIFDSAEKPHVLDSLSGTGAVVNLKI